MTTTTPLKAVFLLGTLKKKQVLSHTDALCEVVAETLLKQENVKSEILRLRDYDIQPGTKTEIDNDDWPGARVATVFSENGRRFVRVIPGESIGDLVGFQGSKRGVYARALHYEIQADRSYRLVADTSLMNPVAPVDLLLSNAGYLIAFDNWHNVGYGKAVAIYGPDGKLVASWELERLYGKDRIKSITMSVSSRWWRCAPFHFVDLKEQTKVYVREALGGYFVFELTTGKFEYFKGTEKCQPPGGPFSATFHGSD